jgi:CP family cyanate transporter-like MFS transporter
LLHDGVNCRVPPFYVRLGVGEDVTGYLLAGLTLAEGVAGLVVAAMIDRFRDRRWPLATTLLLIIAGLACLVLAPIALVVPAMILLGLGIGALFPLSLIVTLNHARGPADAGGLAALVRGGGYIIASLMPFVAGWLRSHSADLSQA